MTPRFDAKAVAVAILEWHGKKFWSVGAETRREFSEKKIAFMQTVAAWKQAGPGWPRTAPDVDAERDCLFHDLAQTGALAEQYIVDGFHKTREGRNEGRDPWHTDGKQCVGIIAPSDSRQE